MHRQLRCLSRAEEKGNKWFMGTLELQGERLVRCSWVPPLIQIPLGSLLLQMTLPAGKSGFLQAMQIFRGWFVNGVFLVLGMMTVIALLNIAKLRIQKWSPEYVVAMVRAHLWSVWQNQAYLMRDAVRTCGFQVGEHVGGFYCMWFGSQVGGQLNNIETIENVF